MGSSPFGADDGIRTRDPHLGNVFRSNFLTCAYSNRCTELAVFDGPRLSASDHYSHRRVVFPWCGFLGILHHGHHMSSRFGPVVRSSSGLASVEPEIVVSACDVDLAESDSLKPLGKVLGIDRNEQIVEVRLSGSLVVVAVRSDQYPARV